MNQSDTGAIGQ